MLPPTGGGSGAAVLPAGSHHRPLPAAAALLSYARTRTPVCVFIEVDAVDRSGFEVLKKLRSENCPAPIFVTSAHGAIPLAVDAIRHGAFDFIVKPVRISEVVDRFEEAVAEYSEPAPTD